MINIRHHGAVNGVTGSCHELTLGKGTSAQGILIDCGLFQGAETSGKGADKNSLEIDFPIAHIKALVVTHVHIDHVGRIPYLLAAGFKGPIYCTEASAQLLPLVLEDAVKIGFTRNKRMVSQFLKHLKSRIKAIPYKQWQSVIDEGQGTDQKRMDIKFQPAGHILGSAYVETRSRWSENESAAISRQPAEKEPHPSLSAPAPSLPVKTGNPVAPKLAATSIQSSEKEEKSAATSHQLSAKESSLSQSAKAGSPKPQTDNLQLTTKNLRVEKRVLFSGDLGAPYAPLLPAPKSPYKTDVLVIESTYGDKNHQGRKDRRQQLKAIIERSAKNGGALLIPAFSIGRTQEILYELESIIHDSSKAGTPHPSLRAESGNPVLSPKPIPSLPVKTGNPVLSPKSLTENLQLQTDSFPSPLADSLQLPTYSCFSPLVIVDSPLAANFTKQYRSLKKFWDKEALARVKSGRHPLSFKQLHTVDSHTDHMALVNHLSVIARSEATWQSSDLKVDSSSHNFPPSSTYSLPLIASSFAIIIAASGMCAGGRITNYLKALIEDSRTDILFIGYQAAGTPGRDIQRYGNKEGGYVHLDGERFDINAKVHTIGGYSAHADQKDLLNFIGRMRHKPKQVRVVHGDDEAKKALKAEIKARWPKVDVLIPRG